MSADVKQSPTDTSMISELFIRDHNKTSVGGSSLQPHPSHTSDQIKQSSDLFQKVCKICRFWQSLYPFLRQNSLVNPSEEVVNQLMKHLMSKISETGETIYEVGVSGNQNLKDVKHLKPICFWSRVGREWSKWRRFERIDRQFVQNLG